MRVACVQISLIEQARIIQLSMNSGLNRSMYYMAIVVPVYLSVEILHTRNTNIYHQRTLFSNFCHF